MTKKVSIHDVGLLVRSQSLCPHHPEIWIVYSFPTRTLFGSGGQPKLDKFNEWMWTLNCQLGREEADIRVCFPNLSLAYFTTHPAPVIHHS